MKTDLKQSGSWIGMSGMAVASFLYAYSAIALRDVISMVVLPSVWLALFVLGCRWFMTRPFHVLALPVVAIAVWFAVMYAGEMLLGWRA